MTSCPAGISLPHFAHIAITIGLRAIVACIKYEHMVQPRQFEHAGRSSSGLNRPVRMEESLGKRREEEKERESETEEGGTSGAKRRISRLERE
jgi:hypothetical protein